MIFVARVTSLIGAAVTFAGILTLFVMGAMRHLLPPFIMEQSALVFAATGLGGLLLIIGQKAGNDLFKLRGQDSLFSLRHSPGSSVTGGYIPGGGFDGGGDAGD